MTGSNGFIGTNLREKLNSYANLSIDNLSILEFNSKDDIGLLKKYTLKCDFIYHLAAVHRPKNDSEFDRVNFKLLEHLLKLLEVNQNYCPILFSSSIQATENSLYGISKLKSENLLKSFSHTTGNNSLIYRLTNTFGPHAKPNSHSVVATFCYNIARSIPICISDPHRLLELYFINNVCDSFLSHLGTNPPEVCSDGFYRLPNSQMFSITLGDLAERIYSIKKNRLDLIGDRMSEYLTKTYWSYVPKN